MTEHPFSSTCYSKLSGFSSFSVSGADANSFLQGQLTNDVTGLALNAHQRTGYCTPKGRLMASFLQWRINDQTLGHLMPAETMETTVKRLRMFVLRAKAVFSSPEQGFQAAGLWGDGLATLTNGQTICLKSGPDEKPSQGVWLLGETPCPILGPRAWLIYPNHADASVQDLLKPFLRGRELPEEAWHFSEIQNGKAWIWAKTQEAFVPQMVNFELTNGVSFTKGCYPGQEVVARSQYLGKLKRRTFRADLIIKNTDVQASPVIQRFSEPPSCGQDIYSDHQTEPCGQLVNAAPMFNSDGEQLPGYALLIECSQDAWAHESALRLGAPDGPELTRAQLPYDFPAAS